MILSTLHKTTGNTHDLYSLRETIDFFPFINLKMLCLFPGDPLYLLVSIPKQLLKVIAMKTFGVLIHYPEKPTDFGSEPKICPDCKMYVFFFFFIVCQDHRVTFLWIGPTPSLTEYQVKCLKESEKQNKSCFMDSQNQTATITKMRKCFT